MKTIKIVFSNSKKVSAKHLKGKKEYTFITAEDIRIGDLLYCEGSFSSFLLVVKIMEDFYDFDEGFEIKELSFSIKKRAIMCSIVK